MVPRLRIDSALASGRQGTAFSSGSATAVSATVATRRRSGGAGSRARRRAAARAPGWPCPGPRRAHQCSPRRAASGTRGRPRRRLCRRPRSTPRASSGRSSPCGSVATFGASWKPGSFRRSYAELLADQTVHLAAVGAALRLAHHEADDRSDGLALAAAELLDGLRVRLESAVDDRLELVRPCQPQRALLDDRRRVAALRREHV